MVSRRLLTLGMLTAFATVSGQPKPAIAGELGGFIGYSDQWGSSWFDLGSIADFNKGDMIRVTLQDNRATSVLIRLLREGQSPENPVGIVGGRAVPVVNGSVTVTLQQDYPRIKQISVHGGRKAWHFDLGASNGPARVGMIERLP